jgi:CPA2 family monovalent cation:H+ antiporter-2
VRELVFGVVLCEDVIAIFMLTVLITLASGRELSFLELSTKVRLLGAFVVLLLAIGIFTVPRLLRGAARFRRKETLLITSLGLCFALAVLAERAGYSVALGAFLAGSLVAESGLGEEVEKLIEPVKQVFGAVFFVAVGMLIDPGELAAHWAALVLLLGVVVVGKIVAVSLASLAIGERPEVAVKCGFAMGQIGVFSLLIAEIGTKSDAMSGFLYTLAAGTCAITMFLCPRLIRLSNPAADWVGRHLPMPIEGALTRYNRWLHPSRKAPEAKG